MGNTIDNMTEEELNLFRSIQRKPRYVISRCCNACQSNCRLNRCNQNPSSIPSASSKTTSPSSTVKNWDCGNHDRIKNYTAQSHTCTLCRLNLYYNTGFIKK